MPVKIERQAAPPPPIECIELSDSFHRNPVRVYAESGTSPGLVYIGMSEGVYLDLNAVIALRDLCNQVLAKDDESALAGLFG